MFFVQSSLPHRVRELSEVIVREIHLTFGIVGLQETVVRNVSKKEIEISVQIRGDTVKYNSLASAKSKPSLLVNLHVSQIDVRKKMKGCSNAKSGGAREDLLRNEHKPEKERNE